jgi:hypothetical protein
VNVVGLALQVAILEKILLLVADQPVAELPSALLRLRCGLRDPTHTEVFC